MKKLFLNGQLHKILDPWFFFINQPHQGLWYGFVFAEIIASKVIKIGFFGFQNEVKNSPTFFVIVKIWYRDISL
jgi:hypothetical protein